MRYPLAVAAVAVTLVLSACGSSSSSSSAVNTTQPPASSATTTPTGTGPVSTTSTSTSTGTSSTGSGLGPCRAASLTLSFIGQQGATGKGELGFALRNKGSVSCHTIGYPGVLFLDSNGGPLPTKPTHTTNDFAGPVPIRSLVVAPGSKVSFRLFVTHFNPNGTGTGCVTAYRLQVIPPNDTASLRISIPQGGASECQTVTVSPMQPGTSAYR